MIKQETLMSQWDELRGKVRQRWGQLTNDELERAHGSVEQLVGLIQRKTGEAREEIEEFLESAAESSLGERVQQRADEYAQQAQEIAQHAGESLQEASHRVQEAVKHGLTQAEETVRERPTESMLVAFGVGLLGGVVIGLAVRPRF